MPHETSYCVTVMEGVKSSEFVTIMRVPRKSFRLRQTRIIACANPVSEFCRRCHFPDGSKIVHCLPNLDRIHKKVTVVFACRSSWSIFSDTTDWHPSQRFKIAERSRHSNFAEGNLPILRRLAVPSAFLWNAWRAVQIAGSIVGLPTREALSFFRLECFLLLLPLRVLLRRQI